MSNLTANNWGQWVVSEFIGTNAFALHTKPSMAPRFPKGTILFIDPKVKPVDGDYVVVLHPGTDEATLREFSTDGPTQLYPSIRILNLLEWTVISPLLVF